jgi:phenylacetate-CoA ligase
MPILRYRVGDVVTLSRRTCPCGRTLPMLECVQGRESDYVVTPEGKCISGISLTENFALLIPGILQIQIIQRTLYDVLLRVVKDAGFGDESLRDIGRVFRERFGTAMRYELEFVDRIAQEKSGKYRFCVSHVSTEYLRQAAAPT